VPSRVRRRPVVLNRDHARPRTAPAPASPAVEARLTELIGPALVVLGDEYRRLGLRERVLSLPVMVGVVLVLIWRQVPSVSAVVRVLERERLLWAPPTRVSQQARSQRLRCLPAALFADLFHALLPPLLVRAAARRRPLPPVVARARAHFGHVWAVDGSAREQVFAKVGRRRGAAGRAAGGAPAGARGRRGSTWPASCRSSCGSPPTRTPPASGSSTGSRPAGPPAPCWSATAASPRSRSAIG
jgi:hypothetical protein